MEKLEKIIDMVYTEELKTVRERYRKDIISAKPEQRDALVKKLFDEELPQVRGTVQHKTLKLRLEDYNKEIAQAKTQKDQEALVAEFVDEVCRIRAYQLK